MRLGDIFGLAILLIGTLMVAFQLVRWSMAEGAYGLYQQPSFLLGVLLVVLGAQTVGFGLVGEIIIFTQAKNLREYRIERIYE